VATAAPGQAVSEIVFPTCDAGSSYIVPAGKALIITRLEFYMVPTVLTGDIETDLFAGPAATPCCQVIAVALSAPTSGTVPQTFDPGIPVPAGDGVGGVHRDNAGTVFMYGYLLPAADVPASAVSGQPRKTLHASGAVRH
jgi:hypothetical protein